MNAAYIANCTFWLKIVLKLEYLGKINTKTMQNSAKIVKTNYLKKTPKVLSCGGYTRVILIILIEKGAHLLTIWNNCLSFLGLCIHLISFLYTMSNILPSGATKVPNETSWWDEHLFVCVYFGSFVYVTDTNLVHTVHYEVKFLSPQTKTVIGPKSRLKSPILVGSMWFPFCASAGSLVSI